MKTFSAKEADVEKKWVVIDAEGKAIIAQGSEINAIDEGVERAYQRMRSAVRASALELKLGAGEFAA